MPLTIRQIAELAHVSEQTARNYTRWYGELLSPAARGRAGTRLFDDEDTRVFCAIADLRRENVPQAEIIERLRRGDVYVDVVGHNTPQQEPQATPNAIEAPYALMLVRSDLQRQIGDLKRTQGHLLRVATLWGVVLGAIGAFVVAGFFIWVLYLFGG
jgi:DNA-binding transcriptional MerR regulator